MKIPVLSVAYEKGMWPPVLETIKMSLTKGISTRRIVQRAYNIIRPFLPKGYGYFNGVKVKDVGILDATKRFPDYEAELCDAINEMIEPGMDVTIVGGGRGVSTVQAAAAVEDRGDVMVYEGSEKYTKLVRETVRVNNVASRAEIRHAVVAEDIGVYTDASGVNRVNPTDLAPTDALVLDCEGAEIAILSEMEIEPYIVVVETHDRLVPGATPAVRHILENQGYNVVTEQEHAEGVWVLSAVQRGL